MVQPSGQRPLEGIRIADFTWIVAGPQCTRIFADLGADVIRIENESYLDSTRNGTSGMFNNFNRNKRSVTANIWHPGGREMAERLIARSDAVVENFSAGAFERMGFGYDHLREINPNIIYLSLSGFGHEGIDISNITWGPTAQAISGLTGMSGLPDQPPAGWGFSYLDHTAGYYGAIGLLQAIYHRKRTGQGQYIDVALLDCMLNILVSECQELQAPSKEKTRVYPPLETRDGYVVVAPTSQKNFEQLTGVIAHPEWLADPRFITSGMREKNWSEFMALIELWTRERSGQEVETLLIAGGVPCTRYMTVREAMANPQLHSRGALSRVEDAAGAYWVPNAPFQMPGLHTSPRPTVPGLGESTVDVLREQLGYSSDEAIACSGAPARA